MTTRLLLVAAFALALASPALADKRQDAKDYVAFGMQLAQKGLWKEAVAQWKAAVKTDPEYAAAWNDLAIGLEQMGEFKESRAAYERALELDPSNQFIRSNYDQARDIYDRQNRRRGGG